jgi:hypothetical protein
VLAGGPARRREGGVCGIRVAGKNEAA